MFTGFTIRFRHWILAAAFTLVLVMTGLFLAAVLGRFQQAATAAASERFAVVAARAADAVDRLLAEQGRRGRIAAGAAPTWFDGERIRTGLALTWLVEGVRHEPVLYSEYLGLPDDGFVQAIAVRDDPAVRAALQAPAGTAWATRVRQPGGTETWRFYAADGATLEDRTQRSDFRPTQRPWYRGARGSDGPFMTAPYAFSSTGRPGVTLASALPGGRGVHGIDVQLDALPAFLRSLSVSANGFVAVLDGESRLLASAGFGAARGLGSLPPLTRLSDSGDARLRALDGLLASLPADGVVAIDGVPHVVAQHAITLCSGPCYRVVSMAPVDDFSGPVDAARRDTLLIGAAMLVLLLPLALLGTRHVTRALMRLSADSERLRRLDFSTPPGDVQSYLYEVQALSDAQRVMHRSIRDRTAALEAAQAKLRQLVESGIRMGREQQRERLLRDVLFGARDLAHCQAATLFIRTEAQTLRFAVRTSDDALPAHEIPLHDPATGEPQHRYVATHVALSGETVVIDDVYAETRFDLSGTKRFSEASGLRAVSMLAVPLAPRPGDVIGVLQLINAQDAAGRAVPFDPEVVGFVEALAAQAAVTLENQNLLEAQKALVDALIQIIAGAIDAKSAYTGGHCERVPELALMLAEAATAEREGPLADFAFRTEEEWREFRIGAWLHDCGKVTTPEYVVDKATKLETIYNRIHEVRTRFEVLLRDAEIERLRDLHERGVPRAEADARCAARRAQLQDDFAFVAECNLGGEFMAPERIERLRAIAAQTWWRHFDDRLGLSHEEAERHAREPAPALPVAEPLLADKPHHIIARGPDKALDPKYGFQVRVPEHLYHHGELYNLSIGRGTLTEEERFKINEHIIQTIVMLDRMPFPKSLRRVPEYAGTHHETLVGTGYPRRLTAAQLSVPARIMAIADIFEALTAADRPYKQAKTLSESIKILSFFKKDGHVDPVLFDLFLTSGVYRRYAERFLRPDQIDEVDITPYLSAQGA